MPYLFHYAINLILSILCFDISNFNYFSRFHWSCWLFSRICKQCSEKCWFGRQNRRIRYWNQGWLMEWFFSDICKKLNISSFDIWSFTFLLTDISFYFVQILFIGCISVVTLLFYYVKHCFLSSVYEFMLNFCEHIFVLIGYNCWISTSSSLRICV